MAKFITAQEAANLIQDGDSIGFAGMGLSGFPEEVVEAIAERCKETGHPRALELHQGSALGDWGERGITCFGVEGLVAKWTSAHIGSALKLLPFVSANKVQCHCLPQGVVVDLWREIATGRPGLITKVGLGTFVDPRVEGGKMNACTTEDIVEVIEINGEEYLLYKAYKVNVALLRGTIADSKGNISFENESVLNEGLAVAQAVKSQGGIVIVQVQYQTEFGTIRPKEVKIPGILVDYVVVATKEENCWQTEGTYYEPAFSGQIRKPLDSIPPLPFNERKVIARRCAMELKSGYIVNLGVGMPACVSNIVAEEGYVDKVTLSSEAGSIGGVPAPLPNFGSAYNPDALIEHGAMFDFIDMGGLNMTCLGIGEVDKHGNNNVSKFGKRLIGPGGFINITHATPKVVFCGTFTNKAKLAFENNELKILQEGTGRKFVDEVQQVTFSGKYAPKEQEVLYVTERAVFRLENAELVLIEIAPGVDLEKDILANMDFKPRIAENLKTMDPAIFGETWGGLGAYIGA